MSMGTRSAIACRYPNKKLRRKTQLIQERSILTREALMSAGREIFVRDGFDQARLEEIAKATGLTRGAFYSHFDDKEDIFLTIVEDELDRCQLQREAPSSPGIEKAKPQGSRWTTPQTLEEKRQWLLFLELNLYARRVHRKSARLVKLLDRLRTHGPVSSLCEVFASLGKCTSDKSLSVRSHPS